VHYVVCHELAHFKHHDHSAAFYTWLSRVLPQHKEWRAVLRSTPLPQLQEN
jgi:predicted metal-dependent hydrolase